MDNYDDRVKLDVFQHQTTYQSDYKKYTPQPHGKECRRKFYEPPEKKYNKEHLYQDNETFVFWKKGAKFPFDSLVTPNEITRGNPYATFEIPTIPEDSAKNDVVKTRPRIYMSPAVSIDDVEEPKMRELLCANMYTTDWKKAARETAAAVKSTSRQVPNSTVELDGDPVQLKIDVSPPLPKNFRNKGKVWEDKQMRASIDPTKTFWIHKDPPVKCGACVNPVEGLVAEETKQEISDLIRRDKLRLAHDVPIPGYTGYRPMLSEGVSLAKRDMSVVHPFLSVNQAITKRYAEDDGK